jgi:large subunit ribosomal protein L3
MENKKTSLVGKKIGMTQIHDRSSALISVTVIQVEKGSVTEVKTIENGGHNAIQFGFGEKKAKYSTKAELGQNKAIPDFAPLKLREMRVDSFEGYAIGNGDLFANLSAADVVDVIGVTKGRGFSGVMKRHGFSGGPSSHGSMFHRRGGSYRQRQWVEHVFEGRQMPGHFGCDRRTIQNLQIAKVDLERGLLLVKGSVPGMKNGFLLIRRAIKSGAK